MATNVTTRSLWCLIEGESDPFRVTFPANASIEELKEHIHKRKHGALRDVDASDLQLFEVSSLFSVV